MKSTLPTAEEFLLAALDKTEEAKDSTAHLLIKAALLLIAPPAIAPVPDSIDSKEQEDNCHLPHGASTVQRHEYLMCRIKSLVNQTVDFSTACERENLYESGKNARDIVRLLRGIGYHIAAGSKGPN
jgi:hypothetical protein